MINKTIQVRCRVCGAEHPAKLEAKDQCEMIELIDSVREYFICQACHDASFEDEELLLKIADILGVPDGMMMDAKRGDL